MKTNRVIRLVAIKTVPVLLIAAIVAMFSLNSCNRHTVKHKGKLPDVKPAIYCPRF